MRSFIWSMVAAAILLLVISSGIRTSPGYIINGSFVKTYTKENGCITFHTTSGSIHAECREYEITAINGAKLK